MSIIIKRIKRTYERPSNEGHWYFIIDDALKIPREVEGATLHVFKHKLVRTNSGVAEFKSGGVMVSDCSK